SRAARRAAGRGTARSWAGDEEELLPGRPPVVGPRDDRPVVDELDAGLEAQLLRRRRALVLDLDLARLAGVVRGHGFQVGESALGAFLDELARPARRQQPRRLQAEALLDLDRRQAVAEQRLGLAAGCAIPRHEQDRTTPRPAERGIDACLADARPVEPEVLPVATRDRVVENTVGRTRHRVHADEERGIAARLEEGRVARPLILDDELAVRIEILGDQRVPAVSVAG